LRIKGIATSTVTDGNGVSKTMPITSAMSGDTVTLNAGRLLEVDDSGQIVSTHVGTSANPVISITSGRDINLGGVVQTDDTTNLSISADRALSLSAKVTAGSITFKSGQGASGDGDIYADSDTQVQATRLGLTLTAGSSGGNIVLNNASFSATHASTGVLDQSIVLSAAMGRIEQVQQMRTVGLTQQLLPSGLMTAYKVQANAALGISSPSSQDAW
jgi:hypothetical protein